MTILIPSISVPNALEAIDFYKKVFDAKLIEHNPFDPSMAQGMALPDNFDFEKSTIHSVISINDDHIYLADDLSKFSQPNGRVEITILPSSLKMIESFYENAVKAGSQIIVKLEKQFWGDYFCRFIDPFGIGWQINFSPPKEPEAKPPKKASKKKSSKRSSTKKAKK